MAKPRIVIFKVSYRKIIISFIIYLLAKLHRNRWRGRVNMHGVDSLLGTFGKSMIIFDSRFSYIPWTQVDQEYHNVIA